VLVDVDQPAQVFGGDCSAMFTDAALSEALGQPVTQLDWQQGVDPESLLVEQAGGIHCYWGTSNTAGGLYVLALPAAAATVPEEAECVGTMLGNSSCPVDVTVNGIRLSGVVTAENDGAGSPERVVAVEALFTANANAAAAGVLPTPIAGAWTNPADCAHVAETVDWVALGGTPVVPDDTMGTDVYASAVERELRGGRVLGWCYFFSPGVNVAPAFWAVGGGAWARDAVLAQEGATVIDAPGFDLVVETPVDGGSTIDIFDGVNWLRSDLRGPETYPALTAVVDVLDAGA
jgi:hypothetical protein